jgi:radical SAM protein with 4Fe4S-binding SPASM domain
VIDLERIRNLRAADVTSFDKCTDCFAKYHCAGDCQARWAEGDMAADSVDVRCELNKMLIGRELRLLVDGR